MFIKKNIRIFRKILDAKIILIFGVDGSGKSTQATLLYQFLSTYLKFRVRFVKLAGHLLPLRIVENFFVSLGYYTWRPSYRCRLAKLPPRELFAHDALTEYGLVFLHIISYLLAIFYYKVLKLLYDIVLVEDGIPRFISDIIYADLRYTKLTRFIVKLLFLLLIRGKNEVKIYLTVSDYNTILRRRKYCAEPKDYINTQRLIYSIVEKYVDTALTVNTSVKTIKEVFHDIIKYIGII